jgi:hypothetical protein
MAAKRFSPHASQSARAVQAWQILVGKAMNRQTVTYERLSELMFGKSAAGVLDRILGHVAFFCMAENLPPLTSIVVGKWGGTPGAGIPVNQSDMDAERERVYRDNWYDVHPPTAEDLKSAYEAHQQQASAGS